MPRTLSNVVGKGLSATLQPCSRIPKRDIAKGEACLSLEVLACVHFVPLLWALDAQSIMEGGVVKGVCSFHGIWEAKEEEGARFPSKDMAPVTSLPLNRLIMPLKDSTIFHQSSESIFPHTDLEENILAIIVLSTGQAARSVERGLSLPNMWVLGHYYEFLSQS